jgi:hypothetical protein
MFVRWRCRLRGWWRTGTGLGAGRPLVVLIDLTQVLPDSISNAVDLVIVPRWNDRITLVDRLVRDGHAVVCAVDEPLCEAFWTAIREQRHRRGRVAVVDVRAAPDVSTV